MSNRNQNQGQRGSNRNQKQSSTFYVPKSQVNEEKNKEAESETIIKSASFEQKNELNQLLTNQNQGNVPDSQSQSKPHEQNESQIQNKVNSEISTPSNKNNQPRGSHQRNKQSNNSQKYNRKQNVKNHTTYVPKSESSQILSNNNIPTESGETLNTSDNNNQKNENSSNNNINHKNNENNKYKRQQNNNQRQFYTQIKERSTVGPLNSNNYQNQKFNLSPQNSNNQLQSPLKSARSTYQSEKNQDNNKVFEDKNQILLQDLAKFKQSSQEFQRIYEEKMTEFMRFHDPKSSFNQDYEKNLSREQRKKNKIIRDSRKNHSIIKSPANQLIPTNWDGLDDIEQSYDFLERKSLATDQSQCSAFGSESGTQSQYFPSLEDNSKLSRLVPSSIKPSRTNSVQSSDLGKDEFKEAIEQIRQEIENDKKKRSYFKSSNDIEASIQSEVIPENELEEEDGENKEVIPKEINKKQNLNQGASQQGSDNREDLTRKDQLEKAEVPQQIEKQTITNIEKKEDQYEKVLSDEEIETNMKLDKVPSQQNDMKNDDHKNQQNNSVNTNTNNIEKNEINNDISKENNEVANNQEGTEQRISNLDDFVPYQMTAEEKEAFEKQYEEESDSQQKINQQQNLIKQDDNKIEKNQPNQPLNQTNQQLEEQQEINDDPLTSKPSCQSPPPTENITTQDVDAVAEKYDDEIINVYVDQDSPIRVRKFSKEKNEQIVKFEKQVIEQLKKENIFEESSVATQHQDKDGNTNDNKLEDSSQVNKELPQDIKQDEQQIKIQEVVSSSAEQINNINSEQPQQIDNQKQENIKVEEQSQEEIFEDIDMDGHSLQKDQQKEERDLQAMNGKSLDEELKQEQNETKKEKRKQPSPQKNIKFENNIDKIISELDQQCGFFNTHSDYASEKQNIASTQDSNKKIEINGYYNEVQIDENLENTNQVEISEQAEGQRQTKFLTQFSENLKEAGKNNAFIINSLGSNIATTFAGHVCNKVVTSSLLKNGKLVQSGNQKTLFSQFSSTNKSGKS